MKGTVMAHSVALGRPWTHRRKKERKNRRERDVAKCQDKAIEPSETKRRSAWKYWPTVPIYPYGRRKTVLQEIVPEKIWTLDQLQGLLYVAVPVRATVVKLKGGGLLVYCPVAPTEECLEMMGKLVEKHGLVQHIVVSTASGIEHKVFAGPFARAFPEAQTWVAPNQWSFPINLPLRWLGLPANTKMLSVDKSEVPFVKEVDYEICGPVPLGSAGSLASKATFVEVAMFHRATKTLLVTDTVVSVPRQPPKINQLYPEAMLFHARDDATQTIEDTPENREIGWRKIALFSLYFQPRSLEAVLGKEALLDAANAPETNRSGKYWKGLFPFQWKPEWKDSFEELADRKLFVAPILQSLVLNRGPDEVLDWVDRVCKWPFETVIPAHFEAGVKASPRDFRGAFSFLRSPGRRGLGGELVEGLMNLFQPTVNGQLPPGDMRFVRKLDDFVVKNKIATAAPDRDP